jgi:hypothetical protein
VDCAAEQSVCVVVFNRKNPMEPMITTLTPTQTAHAIAACERIERGLTAAASRAQQGIQEAARELKRMVEMINADRAARGQPPLAGIDIKVPGEPS